jgi:hypothetical protein
MTPEQITKWAHEAGWPALMANALPYTPDMERFQRFAALVAAHEREMCAKVCDDLETSLWLEDRSNGAVECAAAIRARG